MAPELDIDVIIYMKVCIMLGININMEKGLLTIAHNWYPWNFQHII